ncbi:MAG: hypothetical protein IPJ94_16335 [Chloroflexi bacterium]|nr:hypothetical protein [Chloroflexota bacterium]
MSTYPDVNFYRLKHKSILVIFFTAFFLLMMPITPHTLQKNYDNVQFIRNVNRATGDVLGRLSLTNPTIGDSILRRQSDDACYHFWQSQLWASYNVDQALQLLDGLEVCGRLPENQIIWQGNLTWLTGKPSDALNFWQQLPDAILLQYAKLILLAKEREIGGALIEILSQRAADKPIIPDNGPFFAGLADLYRYAGREKDGLPYRLKAWQSGQQGYLQDFYLGRILAQTGQCYEAVDIIVNGNRQKPDSLDPLLDFVYFLLWGSCYADLGQYEQAKFTYQQARAIVTSDETLLDSEAMQQQMARLNNLEEQLPR